jgi:hypothetical protein
MGICLNCANAHKLNNLFTPDGFSECRYYPPRATMPDEILVSRKYPIVKLDRDGCVVGFKESDERVIPTSQQKLEV